MGQRDCDLALSGRYDFLRAAEALDWPGFGLLAGVLVPTGKAAGQGTNASSTDATGTGTYNLTLGLEIDKAQGPFYGVVDAWVTYCFDLTVTPPGAGNPPMTTLFPLQWTVLALGGYVFDNQAAVAIYANLLERGDDTLDGRLQPGTVLRLTTVGLQGVLPLGDVWRLPGNGLRRHPHLVARAQRAGGRGPRPHAALVRLWR